MNSQCHDFSAQFFEACGPDVVIRQDVDDRRPLDALGVVEAHAVHGAGAAVVAGGEELAVPELLHDFDLVLRHRAERIIDVVLAAFLGPDAVAIAAQIGGDDMEPLGEAAGDLMPGDMGQRVAVQQ